jgi:uncharacterized damage-inducible protein DinB
MTVDELIQVLDESHNAMLEVVKAIDTSLEFYPQWTIRQMLAHLAGWDEATTTSLKILLGGDTPGLAAPRGIDDYNAQSVASRTDLTMEQIIREWELERERLKNTVRQFTDEKLKGEILYPWGTRGTVAELIIDIAGHEKYHAGDVKKIKEQGGNLGEHPI